ncbi:MAG: GNAT family N-acetyltransferase [Candidatus Diapherotrites archaeon]|nr:GNAT family N-acetyltransferase [Candidatus Diapherotrites archaeon]
MRIRALQKKDINAASKVFGEHTYPWEEKSSKSYFRVSLDSKIRNPVYHCLKYWVAEEKGKVVGVVGIHSCKECVKDVYWLGYIAVKKEFQGDGLGTRLYEKAEGEARKRGGRLFCLFTSGEEEQGGSVKFYKKQGFKVAGRIPDVYEEGDDQIYMFKRLK